MQGGMQLQMTPVTPMVKRLIVINLAVWLVLQVIIEQYFLPNREITTYFSLIPGNVINDLYIWQIFSWMFLHSLSITHIVFNMLMLWFFGAELEMRWGPRFFISYYLGCGIGAALIYVFGVGLYSLISGSFQGLFTPVVGASGAIFGILLAFGILFGERTVLFFFLFPMRVKYFVMIIGAIEVVSLLDVGSRSNVANLAHLGGLVSGYLFLVVFARLQKHLRLGKQSSGKRRLRLVVDNEGRRKESGGPKYWN